MLAEKSQMKAVQGCGLAFYDGHRDTVDDVAMAMADSKIGRIGVEVRIRDGLNSVVLFPPIRFGADAIDAAYDIAAAQDDPGYADFEIDLADGEVRYRLDLLRADPELIGRGIREGVAFLEKSCPVLMGAYLQDAALGAADDGSGGGERGRRPARALGSASEGGPSDADGDDEAESGGVFSSLLRSLLD